MIGGQFHGKSFEDWVKACLFPGSADGGRSNTAVIDVEARFDRSGKGLPTSIKAGKGSVVTLADARRFWAIDYEFRLLFGQFRQLDQVKHFHTVHEFLVTPEIMAVLRGEVDAAEVTALHIGIGLTEFPEEHHVAARKWARSEKARLAKRRCMVVLNPKIDSKRQRRLQCSIRLRDLIALCEPQGRYIPHVEKVGSCFLPLRLESAERQFRASNL